MNKVCLLSALLMTLFINSCNQEKKRVKRSAISKTTSKINKTQEENITVRDYLEESTSIKEEAKEIISRAQEINCTEAKQAAEKAIVISNIADTNSNLFRVEHFIDRASKTLDDAEEAITYCEDKDEINFTSELKEEK